MRLQATMQELTELARRVAEVEVLLADVGGELAAYGSDLDADPARLASATDRQATLRRLIRKYDGTGAGVGGVVDWARAAADRPAHLDDDDDRVTRLTTERDQLADELRRLAAAITAARQEAGQRLERAVAAELADLAMPDATVTVAVRPVDLGPHGGIDDVELLLARRPGRAGAPGAPGSVGRRALPGHARARGCARRGGSGSELRLRRGRRGVGGRAAVEVGRRLARLAVAAQVIAVTHLPQVAAFADRHLAVEKTDDGSVTRSGVSTLDGADRVPELSRMLAGQTDSELAHGHAEELLAAAAADRSASQA